MKQSLKIGLTFLSINLMLGFYSIAQNNISSYQYWFDNDYSSQIYTTVSPTVNLRLNTAISLETISDGLHMFNIRFKDNEDRWSVTSSDFFYYNNLIDSNIIAYQYWFDNDMNTNTFVATIPIGQMQLMESISIEDIKEGLHLFSISFMDNKRNWSVPINHYFYKTNQVTDNKIIGYRYWLNEDIANATYVSINGPTRLLNLSNYIDFHELSIGDYTIHFQFKDSSNNWSIVTSDNFSLTSLSVIENNFGNSILAYPNPTKGLINLNLGVSYDSIEVNIFDFFGKLIQQQSYRNEQSFMINIKNNSVGIYFIVISADDKNATLKFMKY